MLMIDLWSSIASTMSVSLEHVVHGIHDYKLQGFGELVGPKWCRGATAKFVTLSREAMHDILVFINEFVVLNRT